MEIFIPAIAAIIFLGIGALVLLFGLRSMSTDDLSSRLNSYVVESATESQIRSPILETRRRELSGSLVSRLFAPRFKQVVQFLGRFTPSTILEELDRQLSVANNPFGLRAREFYGLRIVFILLGIGVFYLMVARFGTENRVYLLIAFLALVIFIYFPKLLLLSAMRRRQEIIGKGLPDALDMLSVCASAGLGFDQAMQRVSEYWDTEVGKEFSKVISEMEVGLARKEALRNMANRLDVRELSSFVTLLIQSEQLGMSISDTLHSQADQMRIERRFKAQEMIRKVPVKMLIPMTFLILPAIFAIILGPAIPQLIGFFENF